MKPPLKLDDKGDMLAFRDVDEALAYAEVVMAPTKDGEGKAQRKPLGGRGVREHGW